MAEGFMRQIPRSVHLELTLLLQSPNNFPLLRYLLLLPSSGLPSISALTPPEWSGIQDMLKDRRLAGIRVV